MRVTKQTSRKRLPISHSPLKEPGKKLSREDIARLNERRAELVYVLRGWHGYGQSRAETEVDLWLRDHSNSE